jgi:hypothetical protein
VTTSSALPLGRPALMFSENVELTGGDLVLLDGVRLGVERFHVLDEAPGSVGRQVHVPLDHSNLSRSAGASSFAASSASVGDIRLLIERRLLLSSK